MRLFLMAGPRVVSTGTRGGSARPHQCSAYAREVGNSNARLFDAYRCHHVITRKVRIPPRHSAARGPISVDTRAENTFLHLHCLSSRSCSPFLPTHDTRAAQLKGVHSRVAHVTTISEMARTPRSATKNRLGLCCRK